MEISDPRSEYYEFDYQGLMGAMAESYRQIMERDYVGCMDRDVDPDDVEASQTAELKPLVEQTNKILFEQGLIGVNGVFMTGGLVPQLEDTEIERTLFEGPVFGTYYGLGLVTEEFGSDEDEGGEVVLSRPRIVHRLKITDAVMHGVDYDINMQLYATLPIESEAFELIAKHNQAELPNRQWLKQLVDDMKDPSDGVYDFARMYEAFKAAAAAEEAQVPPQLTMDWLIDHLNAELGIVGENIVVYTNQMQLCRPMDAPEYWYGEDIADNYIEGRCTGFGVIDEARKVEIEGEPKMISTGKQGLGLFIEAKYSSGPVLIKVPLNAVGAVYSIEEHAKLARES